MIRQIAPHFVRHLYKASTAFNYNIVYKMSTESLPITPGAFTEAIKELPLAVLYSKVSELTNSIAHLHRSNAELRAYLADTNDSEEDKKELENYVAENEGVAVSMKERIELLKTEVENRGQPWIELDELKRVANEDADGIPNGDAATGEGQNGESEEGVYL